ncbi:hypothetical protein MRM63_06715 [bacterium 19MO03SA05]|uniref:YggT family protein n=1 Tax=bacterium 19MO03SA05 TaxID=2920620 RepID=A0AAU6VJY2_UNCXX|nr:MULTISPECIES: hypothetical protein [unclassified Vibrio]EKO3792807.1 hypothetical protein [Vibrio metschnikovii]EKO3920244.1 hypothetical protein [Vibrio metschnikovii]MDQ2107313.1 hypothetical protein [Vibrio sp. 2017_1457_15]MDQ2160125.1 hypothetical protein [Vibrio sp. 2017_1457_13]
MTYIYDAFAFFSGVLGYIYDFLMYIPTLLIDIFSYCWYFIIKIYLFIGNLAVELAYKTVRLVLNDYQVYELLNHAFNMMPDNLRYASYQLGIVDAIRVLIDALGAAFVLRVMGW